MRNADGRRLPARPGRARRWSVVVAAADAGDGLACGTAAFGAEQREQSVPVFGGTAFSADDHIWRYKILFWLGAAILVTLVVGVAALLAELAASMVRRQVRPGMPILIDIHVNTLRI